MDSQFTCGLVGLSKLKTDQQVIQIQDKGSKFVILDQTEYADKMLGQLENPLHYGTLHSDPSLNSVHIISKWSNKWLLEGQIDQDIANWVVNNKAKPGKAFGTIKTQRWKPLTVNYILLWDSYRKSFSFHRILPQTISPRVALLCQRYYPSITKN